MRFTRPGATHTISGSASNRWRNASTAVNSESTDSQYTCGNLGPMSNPIVVSAQAWLREHETELLEDYRAMLRIPSLEAEAQPRAPFGKANREALDLALALSVKYGFKTADIDGYCGYAEFGKGEKMVMSLGHLDVVPTGPGWKYPEFGAEIHDGYVYARGATDDK